MIARSFAAIVIVALALGLLLLFGSTERAFGETWKIHYESTLSCNGDDAGDADDDSCVGNPYTPGATADSISVLNVDRTLDGAPTKHSNYANLRTFGTPPEWNIVPSADIDDGALRARLKTTVTLSILNGPCNTGVPIDIPLFDATTNTNNILYWAGDGDNFLADPDGNGFPAYIDQYPRMLQAITDADLGIVSQDGLAPAMKPLVRLAGHTFATAGAPASKLEFLIFAPGSLAQFKWPYPDRDLGDTFGYINVVQLDNPEPGTSTPSPITDFCEPLNTSTVQFGKTQGKGVLEAGPLGPVFDVPDGTGVNPDGRCATDPNNPLCGMGATTIIAQSNPAAGTGIYGGETHLTGAWSISYRDADGDGINNNEDGCPLDAGIVDQDGDGVEDVCDPVVGTAILDIDGDGFQNRHDNCPLMVNPNQADSDVSPASDGGGGDGIGDSIYTAVAVNCDAGATFCYVNSVDPAVVGGKIIFSGTAGTDTGKITAIDTIHKKVTFDPALTYDHPAGDKVTYLCDPNPLDATTEGAYAVDLVRDAICLGTDTDGDGWCDAEENIVGPGSEVLSNSNDQAAPGPFCSNAVDDDGDTNVNDGCKTVGASPEDPSCVNDVDDDPVDDGLTPRINDGCPMKGSFADCDTNQDGDCLDTGEAAKCEETAGNAVDDDGDTRVNDGCPMVGSLPEKPDCANDIDDDPGDDGGTPTVNDGCPEKGRGEDVSTPEYTGLSPALAGPPSAPGFCSDSYWYDTTGAATAAIDNDGDTLANAAELNCATLAGDTDQDGIVNASDNCPTTYNPEQINTDGDAQGDACDSDDDNDGISDRLEMLYGGRPKDAAIYGQAGFGLDVDGNGLIQTGDVLNYRGQTSNKPAWQVFLTTSLTAACNKTDTCTLASTAGVKAGQPVDIGPANVLERRMITNVAGNVITLDAALLNDHAVVANQVNVKTMP
jgi:hypothetical protein